MSSERIFIKTLLLVCIYMLATTTVLAELCNGDFDCDEDVDGMDSSLLKADFGRNQLNEPCISGNTCNGDFDCDGDCDGTDATTFKSDFGRSPYNNPCPACVVGEWCCFDVDGDGYDTCNADNPNDMDGEPADCDDANLAVYPGSMEVCANEGNPEENIPHVCGGTIQFNICLSCPVNPPCYEWSMGSSSTIGSIINDVTGLYTAGIDCDYLDSPVSETVVVTDHCNGNISDSVTVTLGQIMLEAVNSNFHLGEGGGAVTVSVLNPDHIIKGIQVVLVEGGNILTCTECTSDPVRAPLYVCSAEEQVGGECRIVFYSTNPSISELLLQGEGPVFTVDYQLNETAPTDMCFNVSAQDLSISDESNNELCGSTKSGEICLLGCGDLYPREPSPGSFICGDGMVDIFDKSEAMAIASGNVEPTDCQRMRADVPTGTPPYCEAPDGEINELDVMVISEMALGRMNCCDYYYFGTIY